MTQLINYKSNSYIIAELGLNHDGNFQVLKKMIKEAKESGCDAIKLQSLYYNSTETEKTLNLKKVTFKKQTISLEEYLKKILLNDKQHFIISQFCKKLKIDLISTPFSIDHIDLLKKIKVKKIKISSQDIIHLHLIKKAAMTNLPLIISTGMASLDEIKAAVRLIKKYNNKKITILHCLSSYPSKPEELNLLRILSLNSVFKDCTIGFSDHTKGTNVAMIANLLGAEVFEKHFTHNKKAEGFDHSMSLNAEEMKQYCKNLKGLKKILGDYNYRKILDKKSRIAMRRSLVAKYTLEPGKKIKLSDLEFKRPGNGILVNKISKIIGKKTKRKINRDQQISLLDLK